MQHVATKQSWMASMASMASAKNNPGSTSNTHLPTFWSQKHRAAHLIWLIQLPARCLPRQLGGVDDPKMVIRHISTRKSCDLTGLTNKHGL